MGPRRSLVLASSVLFAAACGSGSGPGTAQGVGHPTRAPRFDPKAIVGEEIAVLTAPPSVPPPITRKHPTKVIVKLEVREKVMPIAEGVDYTFWTFGGTVPGSFIRIREGDLVEFHLSNHPESKMPHNIDLHAVTGPGGGAASSFTAPGHTTQFSFATLNPGLYVYHCATAPVGMHIGNGMYGLILVEPPEGYPTVDREYYVMQGDFYTTGAYGEPGKPAFSMDKALREEPDYVLFNGAVGALTDQRSITANAGETVRLFFGNGGPNLVSSFHVIGEIFDVVYDEAGGTVKNNVQTTLVPAGGAAILDFKVDVPGTYILVDHSIFRAFNKGALAMLQVTGKDDLAIYSGKQHEGIYLPEGSTVQMILDATKAPELPEDASKEQRIEHGSRVFTQNCMPCHQADGKGIPHAFPPLAKSDFLMADKKRAINVLLKGLTGKVVVNGVEYNGVMPALALSDDDIASVLTYAMNSWGNSGNVVKPSDVRALRSGH